MLRSLHTKLVLIMVLLVVCLMTIAGAFLINSVNRFFVNEFYSQMQDVFTKDTEFVRDLVTKPFSIRELMARVKANVRRAERSPLPPREDGRVLALGRLRIDRDASLATKDGANLELTQREFELLTYLASNPGKVFSRQELMERVWNYEGYVGDVRGVDVAVRRLREKVEDNPATPKYILTRRGVGYLFERPEEE